MLFLSLLLLTTACNGGEINPVIAGTWELTDYLVEASESDASYDWYADGLRWTLTFEPDGTLQESWREGDEPETGGGTWEMEGDQLTITFDIDPGETFTPTIDTFTADRLELSFEEPWDFGAGEEAGTASIGLDAQ